jgi:hypothetical protein
MFLSGEVEDSTNVVSCEKEGPVGELGPLATKFGGRAAGGGGGGGWAG